MADLSKTIEVLFNATDHGVSSVASGIKSSVSSLDTALGSVAGPLNDLANKALAAETAIVGLGAAFVGVSLSKAGEFGNKINEIGTVAGTSKQNLAAFSNDILDYGIKSSKALNDVNEAVYQSVSAGIDYSNSLDFIKVAEDLAVGGRAQLSDTTNVLIGSMNAYGISNKDAAAQLKIAGDYADIMFVAVQKGVVTIPELSQQLGDVTSTAAASGVSFADLNAAIAALTSANIKAPQAVTALKQAISEIIKPSKQAAEAAAEMGLAFDAQSLKDQGLPTFMRNLQTATGGNVEKLSMLFDSVEAVNAVMTLASDSAGVFAGALKAMDERAGIASNAASEMANSWENASQRLVNAADVAFVTFGKKIEQEAGKGLNGVAGIFNAFTVSLRSGAFDPVFDYLNAAGADMNKAMSDIAKNLPQAMSNIDFSGLLDSFDGLGESLKSAFEAVFGQVDLSTPEGVKKIIQEVINGIQFLTEVTTGIVNSFRPYALALGDIIQRTEGLGTESNKQIGNVLGIAKAIENFGIAVVALGRIIGDDKNSINRFFTGVLGLAESVGAGLQSIPAQLELMYLEAKRLVLQVEALFATGDDKIRLRFDLASNAVEMNDLERKIGQMADRYSEGFSKIGKAITGSTVEATAGMENVASATGKAVDSSKGFEPINLGDIDFVAEGMKRLGDNTWLAKRYTSDLITEVERITLPDGATKITDSLGNITIVSAKAKTATEGLNDSVKKSADDMEKAQKAAEDYALKLMEASNKVKIAGMETWGKINIAQIEADTKQVESMFKSIDNTVSTTGKGISDLWNTFSKVEGFDQSKLLESIRKQEQIQQDSVSKQNELLDQQIRLIKLKADQMSKGDAVINVEATGLKPHLELIFGEILKETQIKATEQGLNLLLGFTP